MKLHHIAIICSNYKRSKEFYTSFLGLKVIREVYRKERESYKLDLSLNGEYLIELFSFPSPPPRPSRPESTGLRHIAFGVENLEEERNILIEKGIECEAIRIDEFTDKKFFFFADPDNLPIEFYQL